MLFIAVTLVTFVIFFVIPADPARQTCGQRATPECIARAQHFLGTDRPVLVQYGRFLDRLVVHQSLGRSFTNRQDVTQRGAAGGARSPRRSSSAARSSG